MQTLGNCEEPASQWRSLPDEPSPKLMMAWTVLDDKIWIAGGMRHGEMLQLVQSYDTQTGAWRRRQPTAVRWWSSGAPATDSRTRRTRFSRYVEVVGWSYRALRKPGGRGRGGCRRQVRGGRRAEPEARPADRAVPRSPWAVARLTWSPTQISCVT